MYDEDVKRGDIYFAPHRELNTDEIHIRPCVIVSNDILNKKSPFVEVVWLTTADKKPMPTHTTVTTNKPSTSLCENITTIAKDSLGKYLGEIDERELEDLDRGLMSSLGLQQTVTTAIVKNDSRVEMERDFYKKQYEMLLEKVIR